MCFRALYRANKSTYNCHSVNVKSHSATMIFQQFQSSYARPVAIVFDDHNLYAQSFASFLERMGAFQSVYTFNYEEDMLQQLFRMKQQQLVYIFLDYYLQNKVLKLSLINDLKRMYKGVKIIVISSVTNPILINEILQYKIDGFLGKASDLNEITHCLQQIEKQKSYISPYINTIINEYTQLPKIPFSAREIEILQHFAIGHSVNSAALELNLSKHTIVSHRRRMMAKSNTHSITELLAFARKIGLL